MREIVLRAETHWLDLDLKSVWEYRDLLSLLVWRDFASRYKQTVLGPLWFIIQPLLMTVVFMVVFGIVAGLSTDGLPSLLFYMCGQVGWNYCAQTFTSTSTTLVANAALFGKVYFPRLVVPIAAAISNLFALVIQGAMFAGFYLYFKSTTQAESFGVTWYAAFLPLLVLHTAVIGLGVGLLLAAVTAKYRDLIHATGFLLQAWMYATPIIYPLTVVPADWRWLAALNPMTFVVEASRLMLLGTGTVRPGYLALSLSTGVGLLAGGLLLFRRVEKGFVDIA